MAKEKRFPAPANQKKAALAPAPAAPAPGPLLTPAAVAAKASKTVQVHYKKKNHHILGIGAHALANGINTLPDNVWADAQNQPSIQQLIKDGHLVDLSGKDDAVINAAASAQDSYESEEGAEPVETETTEEAPAEALGDSST